MTITTIDRDISLQVAGNRLAKSLTRASKSRRDGIALKILGINLLRASLAKRAAK